MEHKLKESENMQNGEGFNLNEMCLVMELFEEDVDQLMKNKKILSESNLIRTVYNSLCSIAFLHEANVMHRDMKSSNLLINSDFNVKVGDFGLSRTIPQSN